MIARVDPIRHRYGRDFPVLPGPARPDATLTVRRTPGDCVKGDTPARHDVDTPTPLVPRGNPALRATQVDTRYANQPLRYIYEADVTGS